MDGTLTSSKKRRLRKQKQAAQRKAEAAPAPSPVPAPAPAPKTRTAIAPPEPPTKTPKEYLREDLARKAKLKAMAARVGQTPAMLAASQQAAKQLLSNYQKGTLSASELKILADLENELEDCGGSIETLLKKRHVAPDLISYVQNVVGKVTSGEATITDALSGLVA